jgi:predicted GIY-YIG superfamily endonuclease
MTQAPYYIYRAYAADGDLLYIGRTIDPNMRLAKHYQSSPWVAEVMEWEFQPIPRNWYAMCAAERAAIEAEHPRYNVQWNTPKEQIA